MNDQRTKANTIRFAKLFPPRAKALGKQIELLENCSNKRNYVVHEKVAREAIMLLANMFKEMVREYDVGLRLSIINENDEEED